MAVDDLDILRQELPKCLKIGQSRGIGKKTGSLSRLLSLRVSVLRREAAPDFELNIGGPGGAPDIVAAPDCLGVLTGIRVPHFWRDDVPGVPTKSPSSEFDHPTH